MIRQIAALMFVASLVFPKPSQAAEAGVRMVAAEILGRSPPCARR